MSGSRVERSAGAGEVARLLAERPAGGVSQDGHLLRPEPRQALAWPSVRWFHVGGSGRDHLPPWDPTRVTVTDSAGVSPRSSPSAPSARPSPRACPNSPRTAGGPLVAHALARWRAHHAPGGLGHTGVGVARRARALGMEVVAVRASGLAHPDADEVHGGAPRALLPRAEVLSLHVRLTEAAAGMIGAGELALLPPGALVLNAARGAVLSEEGLLEALERNDAGAWLDVFEEEPLPELNPLWHHPRILVSPHCADQVADFPARFAARFRDLWLASR